jgi:hypothetical protein
LLLVTAAALRHVTGSPGPGLLRRLRPVPARSADGGPSPPHHAGSVARQARTGTVPVFTAIRSTKEEPDFVPAASPRLPRSTSPWPPAEPSMNRPGVPRPPPAQRQRAGARRSRPISARFGAGTVLRDFQAPVPLVLLSVTLAGPALSGSASTPRRCQGCSRPPRHLPDQAALSYAALLRQGQRRWSLTPARINSASRRTGWWP